MKVTGSKVEGARRAGGAGPAKPSSGGGFAVQGQAPARESAPAARTSGVTGVASLDALLALQQADGPLERRRRAVGRATRILDVLDDIKVELLEGGGDARSLTRLVEAVREERSATEDPRLEGVLDEIETRAAVELAKREARPAAA
jgi:hypothetical protein